MDFIVDEKFAADDEEQDDAGQNVRKIAVKPKLRGHFIRAARHEDQQHRGEHHHQRIEFCKPRDHDGGEASAVRQVGVDGVGRAAHQQKTRDAAQGARQRHRAHNDLFHVDADIPRGVFTAADNGNFIAVLAVF